MEKESLDLKPKSCAVVNPGEMHLLLTREETEKWMDELARKYVETHDPVVMTYYAAHLNLQTERANGTMSRPFDGGEMEVYEHG